MLINVNACIILENGSRFLGVGIGKQGTTTGEICFNTAMTGYQEVLSDPSYGGQIIIFSFPHVGNVGVNEQDMESKKCFLKGVVLKDSITAPSNHRSQGNLNDWLIKHKIIGISQVDTRALIKIIRNHGPLKGLIYHDKTSISLEKKFPFLTTILNKEQGVENKDFSLSVATQTKQYWKNWKSLASEGQNQKKRHIVIIDFGVKMSIIRELEKEDCVVTLLPPHSIYEDIIVEKPDGVLLSNGPGDPRPIASYVTPIIQKLIKSDIPVFGICLGHQLLGLALGGKVEKMITGHHGINHPVKNLENGKIEITSQNHEFTLNKNSLANICTITHISLFDGSVQGIALKEKSVFSVQFHPEASPGPHDSLGLFKKFLHSINSNAKKN